MIIIPKTVLVLVLSIAWVTLALAQTANSDATKTRPSSDPSSVLVQLNGEPLSTYVQTKPAQGKKIDFNNNSVKSYRAQLSALRNDFKKWLMTNAPKAKVTGEYDISLNAVSVQLNGERKTTIEQAPLALRVEYQGLYYPIMSDPDLSLIHALEAWSANGAGGPANAGQDIKVAIVDSGIDINHPCFDGSSYPAANKLGDSRFTNNKVIAAKVFNNKAGNQGLTPEAIDSHGTHVAGTVGCNYSTSAVVDGVPIPYGVSGVAPRVLLGNYNVFPGTVGNARSEDILNALEAAYADGFDVANMSLGGGASGGRDLLTIAVDDLDQANMVVAVAAGNDGPGYFTVGSPGSAARALTAGASSVGHILQAFVTVAGVDYPAVRGEFGSALVSGPLAVVLDSASPYGGLSTACSPLPAGSLSGKIALISRGDCDFTVKILNAQNAGAVGAVVVNREPGIFTMGTNGAAVQPTIPAYMVDLAVRETLKTKNGAATSFNAAAYIYDPAQDNIMADFSSQGPTDVDFRVKPDVVAPGVNVLSSVPLAYCGGVPCWAFFQGTSMATPHLAGSAAVVRGQHPTWSAAQIRSAIVNTADQGVLKNYSATTALETDVNVIGAGRENLLSSVNAQVALDPVSVSFGSVAAGAGQTKTYSVALNNLSSGSKNFALAVGAGGGGVSYTVSPTSVSLAAGAIKTVTVTMSATKRASTGGHQATLTVSSGGTEVAHAVVYTLIK
ncbi:MAG: S8 family serine peptidase [Pyrinomonadaceae bacterium]|nr:S8 family serine peptidase [Pyrinomonadaceae bacterium]